MKSFKKIVSCFLFIAILTFFLCVTPASAAEGVAGTVQNFTEWSVRLSENVANGFWRIIYGDSWREDELPDPEEAAAKYEEYVNGLRSDLGTTTLLDDGGVRIYFKPQFIIPESFQESYYIDTSASGTVVTGRYQFSSSISYVGDRNILYVRYAPVTLPFQASTYQFGYVGVNAKAATGVSISGSLAAGSSIYPYRGANSYNSMDGMTPIWGDYVSSSFSRCVTVKPVRDSDQGMGPTSFDFTFSCYVDIYPNTEFVDPNTYQLDLNTRPASIVGDYGIMGDDGSITKIEGITLVNETDKSVYNPITTTQTKYTDCVFDYADRSYTLTLEDGSTMKVVYGDENITINEGDTVYNVYYLVENSDSSGGGGSGSGDNSGGDGGILGGAVSGFLGALGDVISGLISGLLFLATKALEALVGLGDLLRQMGEALIGFFGGFTDFLGAVFSFLPEETFAILNLGLILMIAAAVFKKFF